MSIMLTVDESKGKISTDMGLENWRLQLLDLVKDHP